MEQDIFAKFDKGSFAAEGVSEALAERPWNEHKDFKGVFLKSVVDAELTGGLFNCLLVRIEPGMKIGWHNHPNSLELHEVMAGGGKCLLGQPVQMEISYAPGTLALIPAQAQHEVQAGPEGLRLFAKFVNLPVCG